METSLTGLAWKLSLGVPPTTGGDSRSDFTSDFTLSDFTSEIGLNLSLSVFTCVCGVNGKVRDSALSIASSRSLLVKPDELADND